MRNLVVGTFLTLDGVMQALGGLELAEPLTSSTGAVLQVLRPTGRPTYGSFALEEPTAAEIERREKVRAGA